MWSLPFKISFVFVFIPLSMAARILVHPYTFGWTSRLANLLTISEILGERGHDVTLLVNHRSLPRRQFDYVEVMAYPAPKEYSLLAEDNYLMMNILNGTMFSKNLSSLNTIFCEYFLEDKSLFPTLRSLSYDLLIVDYANTCARILVDFLNIPTIVWSNFGFSIDDDLFYPIFPSFVPSTLGVHSDQMNLWQRLKNFLEYHLYNQLILYHYAFWDLNKLKEKHGHNASLFIQDAYRRAKPLIFCNADFSFDYPRPLMPHIIPISGLFVKDAQPLDDELEAFIQSSGPHGAIIVSFGSLFKYFDEKRTRMFARVLSKLPQNVIWRMVAPFPIEIGDNTKVLSWLPQNDLLGHKQTRLFITHCGISSSYEAIYHQVPIVGVPLIADQWFNCEKLTGRGGMGVKIDFFNLNEEMLENAIKEVLQNKTYKENAVKLNTLLQDQPQKPKEKLIYWTEYVIRHKGVEHLHSKGLNKLSWYQYLCIDVMILSVAIIAVALSGMLLILMYCCKGFCLKRKKEKTA